MTTYMAQEFVGVADGTNPPKLADGRSVKAKLRRIRAVKDNTNALVAADKIYIGQLPVGATLDEFGANTDTTWGTTTISIGTLGNPTKYVNGATLTTLNNWVLLGPLATGAVQAPATAAEDLYVTLGVGGLAAVVKTAFRTQYTISA